MGKSENGVLSICNPHAGVQPTNVPLHEFVQGGRVHFFQHTGIVENDTVRWSNGVQWTRIKQDPVQISNPVSQHDVNPRYFVVQGNVQNVMFRQTMIRAMQSRSIKGGATNHSSDKTRVDLTLVGKADTVNELVGALSQGKNLNSWGAKAQSILETVSGMPVQAHQVNTDNVDSFSWNPD